MADFLEMRAKILFMRDIVEKTVASTLVPWCGAWGLEDGQIGAEHCRLRDILNASLITMGISGQSLVVLGLERCCHATCHKHSSFT